MVLSKFQTSLRFCSATKCIIKSVLARKIQFVRVITESSSFCITRSCCTCMEIIRILRTLHFPFIYKFSTTTQSHHPLPAVLLSGKLSHCILWLSMGEAACKMQVSCQRQAPYSLVLFVVHPRESKIPVYFSSFLELINYFIQVK